MPSEDVAPAPSEPPAEANPIQRLVTPFVERSRLYSAIDGAPRDSVVWLAAAGGYGKTTLVRSYARRNGSPVIELAIPEGGMTGGELFHALRAGVEASLGTATARELPVFGPEHSGAPENFARRFAEALCSRITEPILVTVDDAQNLEARQDAEALLPHVIEIIADGPARVLIASRSEPPPAWAGLRGRARLHVLDESALAFTRDEVAMLIGERAPDERARALHERTRGWAAGLMLALEQWRRSGEPALDRRLDRPLDEWFATEVMERVAPVDRELLHGCALPAFIPATRAGPVTGIPDAEDRLHRLARQHAFIEPDERGDETVFRLHDLFRTHLQRRIAGQWPGPKRRALSGRWGQALWERGDWNQAAPLLVQAEDWAALGGGIKEAAPVLLNDGRAENLYAWLQEIPAAIRRADPELTLWEGMCLILHDTARARALLVEAWEALSPRRSYTHMAVAWTGIIDSAWMEKQHVSFYDRWIDEFLHHQEAFREHLPHHLWLALLRGMVAAMAHGRPHDPSLGPWEREALQTLAGEMPDNERLMLAGQLMFLYTWQLGQRAGAERVTALMQGHAGAVERASPLPRAVWLTFTSVYALFFEADLEACKRDAGRARELIIRYGLRSWECGAPPIQGGICYEDEETVREWMQWFMRGECKAHRAFYDSLQAHFLAGQAWLQGDVHGAVSHCRDSLIAVEHQGAPVLSAGFRGVLASCLAEAGDHAEALREAAAARRARRGFPSAFLDLLLYIPLARIPLLRKQPERALPYVRRIFSSGARQYLFFPFLIRRRELAALCALALQHGIHPEYARWLIAKADLPPPADPALRARWPWPVRLRTLGRMHIERQGEEEPTPLHRRSRHGQIALLSALVMAGPSGLSQEELAARLWPDSGRDQVRNSFHVTCHRLRELLGDTEALLSDAGRIALNPNRVRVDAWELLTLARAPQGQSVDVLEAGLSSFEGSPTLPGMQELEGDFFETEVTAAYQEVAEELVQRLEPVDAGKALRICQRALAHASLNETLWAAALRCAARQGQIDQLQRLCTHMRQTYSGILGEPPPCELEALCRGGHR